MDQFKSLLPIGKEVSRLEDLSTLTVSELKKILRAFKNSPSGLKADLIMKVYAIFCRLSSTASHQPRLKVFEPKNETVLPTFSYSFIKNQAGTVPWTTDLRYTPPFSFIQLYDYLVIRTIKYKHILLKNTSYKKLKAFQFFYEGFIKKLEVTFSNSFYFFDARVKASMRSKFYKVIIKLPEDGNVCSAACTCPAGVSIGGFGNCNHVGGILFGLEDFNRKGLKELPMSEHVHQNYLLGMYLVILLQTQSLSTQS